MRETRRLSGNLYLLTPERFRWLAASKDEVASEGNAAPPVKYYFLSLALSPSLLILITAY
jgi:hypothetical protein